MTDWASLALKVDSTEVKTGVQELDRLTSAGGKAESSVGRLGSTAQQIGASLSTTGKGAAEMAKAAQDVAATWGRADLAITSLASATAEAKAEIASTKAALAAGAISQTEYEKSILQTKAALHGLETQYRSAVAEFTRAKAAQDALTRGGNALAVSAGQQRAAMQQLSYQIGDVSQQLALGVNPMTIFVQQSGQIVQAIGMMRGTAGGFIGFMAGPWGAALMGAATVVGMLTMKMLEAEDATKKVEFASYALRDVQGILGNVFDLTTGKINTQSSALMALAQAQLLVARVQAQARQAEARSQIAGMTDAQLTVSGGMGGGVFAGYRQGPAAGVAKRVLDGTNTAKQALDQLENLRATGSITAEEFSKGAAAIASYGVEMENLAVLGKGLSSVLNGELDPALRKVEKAKKPKGDRHAETLLREARATEALIAGLGKLADAYLESDAAALKAEITAKAEAEGIKKRADVAAYVARQIRLEVAERTAGAAKAVAAMRAQNDAQQMVNNQVAQGLMTSEEAQRFLRDEAQLRPYITALAVAEGAEKERLTKTIAALRIEQARANDETVRAQSLAMAERANRRTREISAEAGLDAETGRRRIEILGSNMPEGAQSDALRLLNAEHEKRLILLRAEIEAEDLRKRGMDDAAAAILRQAQAESEAVDVKAKLATVEDAMARLRDISDSISFGSVFGEFGDGVDGMIASLKQLSEAQAAYEAIKQNGSAADIERERAKFTDAQTTATIGLIGASKKFFNEQSTGYKVLTAIEKVYAAIKLANMVKAMVIDTTYTGTSVANAMTRATADQAAGASKMFSFLGPFAFPVVAAMIALLAGLGVKGGSGGGAPAVMSAEDMQKQAGTGTVLGDPTAKSNSIANSIEIIAANTNRDLEYSNAMLVALRSINSNIVKLSGDVARQITVSGSMFDTSRLNLGSSGSGGFLGLFSSSTTRELWDLGMILNGGSVADIIAKGITGQTYQVVQQIKKKSGFLGIGGGTKTTYETTYGQIDAEILSAIQGVVTSLRDGLVTASSVIGLEGAEALLDSFRVEIGQLSFKDMTGEEIEKQLNAVFSRVGDQMAAALLPSLKGIQQIGEGLFETFMRAARQYQVVDISLKSIGLSFGMIGVESLGARDALVQMFESLDAFVEQTDFYRKNFLTEAEQMAPVISSVADEMVRLGLAAVDTVAEFKAVIDGLDLTTTAGQQTYAALMAVAPAFSSVIKYQDKLAKSYDDQAISLRSYLNDLLGKGSASSLAVAAAQFRGTATQALLGDLDAMGSLKGASNTFLEAAKASAKSPLDYARARAEVLRTVSEAANVADSQAEIQRKQLAAAEALAAEVAAMRTEQNQINASMANSLSALNNTINTVTDGDALKVTSGTDQPFNVDVAA